MVVSRSFTDRMVDWLIAVLLLAVGVTTLLPLFNTLAISLSDKAAVSGGQVGFVAGHGLAAAVDLARERLVAQLVDLGGAAVDDDAGDEGELGFFDKLDQ